MNTDLARQHVEHALQQVVPGTDVTALAPDEPLRDALEMDSLDFLAFVEQLSADSGVRLDEDDYPALATYDSCVRFLAGAAATAG